MLLSNEVPDVLNVAVVLVPVPVKAAFKGRLRRQPRVVHRKLRGRPVRLLHGEGRLRLGRGIQAGAGQHPKMQPKEVL